MIKVETALWWLAVAAAVLSLSFTAMVNSDLWFHLAAGELILDSRAVPRTDTWSFTATDRTWQNHEWLADVVFASLTRLVGLENLVFWQWTLILAAFLLLLHLLHRLGISLWLASLITVLSAALAAPLFDLRPHLWTLLGTVLMLHIGLLKDRLPSALPLVFALWANLHGGSVFGLALLTMLRFCRIAERRPWKAWESAAGLPGRLAASTAAGTIGSPLPVADRPAPEPSVLAREGLLLAACAAALCATPFGIDTVLYPLRLLRADSPSRQLLAEWISPWRGGPLVSPLFPASVALAVVAAILVSRKLWRRLDGQPLGALAAAILTAAMASASRRFVILFAVAVAVLITVAAREFRLCRPGERSAAPRAIIPAAAALILALVRLAPMPLGAAAFIPTTRLGSFPVENMTYVETNELRGRVFAYFLWGGYVDWRTRGALRVFIDPRSETLFAPSTQLEYERIRSRAPGWLEALTATGADFVLWPTGGQNRSKFVAPLIASGLWREVNEDAVSVLLARINLAIPPSRQTPPSPYRDWAAASAAVTAGRLAEAETLLQATLAAIPELEQPCELLVRVQTSLGKSAAARETQRQCRAVLP